MGAIGQPIDLALIAIPAASVLQSLEECARAGVRNAVIISSGFAEEGGSSAEMQGEIAALARRTGMRISGPNAEGFYNEIGRVAATFSPAVDVKPGAIRHIATTQNTSGEATMPVTLCCQADDSSTTTKSTIAADSHG